MIKILDINWKWLHALILSVALLVGAMPATAATANQNMSGHTMSAMEHQVMMDQMEMSSECDMSATHCGEESSKIMDECCQTNECKTSCASISIDMTGITSSLPYNGIYDGKLLSVYQKYLTDHKSATLNPPPIF